MLKHEHQRKAIVEYQLISPKTGKITFNTLYIKMRILEDTIHHSRIKNPSYKKQNQCQLYNIRHRKCNNVSGRCNINIFRCSVFGEIQNNALKVQSICLLNMINYVRMNCCWRLVSVYQVVVFLWNALIYFLFFRLSFSCNTQATRKPMAHVLHQWM